MFCVRIHQTVCVRCAYPPIGLFEALASVKQCMFAVRVNKTVYVRCVQTSGEMGEMEAGEAQARAVDLEVSSSSSLLSLQVLEGP